VVAVVVAMALILAALADQVLLLFPAQQPLLFLSRD
jgi:hypothetical protein